MSNVSLEHGDPTIIAKNLPPVAVRVALGARFMDETWPGWHKRIDTDRLDISMCEHCIYGQIVGEWDWDETDHTVRYPETHGIGGFLHGFIPADTHLPGFIPDYIMRMISTDHNHDQMTYWSEDETELDEDDAKELTEAWIDEIYARRVSDAKRQRQRRTRELVTV